MGISRLGRMLLWAFLAVALTAQSVVAERRVALVIGNSQYTHVPVLANPVNDATDVSARLAGLGFEVISVTDGDQRAMLTGLSKFGRAATNADVALVFYAGHGAQVSGRNWLLPVSADIRSAADLPAQAVRLNDLMDVMDASGAKVKLVFLDACRNNPLPKAATRAASRGLARVDANVAGTLIAFATAPETVADDGTGRNSPFTKALLRHIATPGLEIRQMIGRVREAVYKETNRKQLPWVNEALIGQFYFSGKPGEKIATAPPLPAAPKPQPAAPKPEPAGPSEKEVYGLAQSINTVAAWDAFLNRFPDSVYAPFAKAARDKLKAAAAPAPQPQPQPKVQTDTETQTALAPPPEPEPETRDRSLGGFIFPDSHRRRLRNSDLRGLSRAQLRVARNEIFARRGRYFKSADLRAHFGRFDWYRPFTWNPRLNRTEKANVRLIQRAERR